MPLLLLLLLVLFLFVDSIAETSRFAPTEQDFHHQTISNPRTRVSFDFGWWHRTGLTDWAAPDDEPPMDTDPGLYPPESRIQYNTSSWTPVTLPHDGLIANSPSSKACPDGCSGQSYIPRHVLWYRKRFRLPKHWLHDDDSNAIWLEFEGSFRNTTVWINGELAKNHECGYTSFHVPLNNVKRDNVIAVYVDPDNGDKGGRSHASGWWYEGGGLYRSVHLVRTHRVHVQPDSLFAYSNITFSNTTKGEAKKASLHVKATIDNISGVAAEKTLRKRAHVCVSFHVTDSNGASVAYTDSTRVIVSSDGSTTVANRMEVKNPSLWSLSSPTLYSVSIHLKDCHTGKLMNADSTTHGFRSLQYTANHGMYLNQEHYKVRGFCDHNSFGVVGMAVPDRINLFRAQALRSIGGNARRMSHNPPSPTTLDIYDRLGIVVMNENRLFDDNPKYVQNMGDLVRRDRNHPSVVIWSFCNEGDCEGENQKGGPAFQDITYQLDGTRPTLANMFTYGDLLSNLVDVQGFSHRSRQQLDDCHRELAHKPIFMSECCSCNTMRSEDVGCETTSDNPHDKCTEISFNARCL